MRVEQDIVAISIPFSAGVALAAVVSHGCISSFGIDRWQFTITAALISIVTFALIIKYVRSDLGLWTAVSIFFCLGLMVGLNSELSFSSDTEIKQGIISIATRAKVALLETIDSLMLKHSDTGELAKALLTGEKSGLSSEIYGSFRSSGTAHILSLSGLHMGVIYVLLQKATSWLGRSQTAMIVRACVTTTAAGFFVIMTGASPSVVRAFIFIFFHQLSQLRAGRQSRPIKILCAALMLQLLFEPTIIKSIGFQLSYLAMLGIILIFPKLNAWFNQEQGVMKKIWGAASLTISCQLTTAPLVWLYFKTFPTYFLITNIIAIPLTEIFIFFLVACLFISIFAPCPLILKDLTDIIGQVLMKSLELIASL